MNAIQLIKSLQLLWRNVGTQGLSLADVTQATARKHIKSNLRSALPLKNRKIQSFRPTARSHFPFSIASEVKYHTESLKKDPHLFIEYNKLSAEEKILTLTYNGLRMLGVNFPHKILVNNEEIKKAWEKLEQIYDNTPPFEDEHPIQNFIHLSGFFPPFNPKVQTRHFIDDFNEALMLFQYQYEPLKKIMIPFGIKSSEDSIAGLSLLENVIKPDTFILEDGSSNGQHLVYLIQYFELLNIPISGLGTDIAFYNTNLGTMLVSTLKMDSSCAFCVGNALHRSSPRDISGKNQQHIVLAYRLLPVFDEQKIFRYLEKMSLELLPGDLWCGSIALPEGKLFTKNTTDKAEIEKYSIQAIPTSFGGTTLVHRPFQQDQDEEVIKAFSEYKQYGLDLKKDDLKKVVLNTYITEKQFENLIMKFGFKFKSDPIEVECHDNKRLTVLLEKI